MLLSLLTPLSPKQTNSLIHTHHTQVLLSFFLVGFLRMVGVGVSG